MNCVRILGEFFEKLITIEFTNFPTHLGKGIRVLAKIFEAINSRTFSITEFEQMHFSQEYFSSSRQSLTREWLLRHI